MYDNYPGDVMSSLAPNNKGKQPAGQANVLETPSDEDGLI
jgi:hypothetical protein